MHVHIGLLEFLKIGAYITVWGFFWRMLAMRFCDTPVGQAMGFIY